MHIFLQKELISMLIARPFINVSANENANVAKKILLMSTKSTYKSTYLNIFFSLNIIKPHLKFSYVEQNGYIPILHRWPRIFMTWCINNLFCSCCKGADAYTII